MSFLQEPGVTGGLPAESVPLPPDSQPKDVDEGKSDVAMTDAPTAAAAAAPSVEEPAESIVDLIARHNDAIREKMKVYAQLHTAVEKWEHLQSFVPDMVLPLVTNAYGALYDLNIAIGNKQNHSCRVEFDIDDFMSSWQGACDDAELGPKEDAETKAVMDLVVAKLAKVLAEVDLLVPFLQQSASPTQLREAGANFLRRKKAGADGSPEVEVEDEDAGEAEMADEGGEGDDEADNPDNDDIIRAKWCMDGAKTLTEAAQRLRAYADSIDIMAAKGYELRGPIEDDYGFVKPPKPDADVEKKEME